MNAARRIPAVPAAARRLGATKFTRCVGRDYFALGFKLVGDDTSAPGNGQAIVNALRLHWGDDAEVSWNGRQSGAIIVRFVD